VIDGKSVLAIIPARGGSKGIPHKNLCVVAGKPLLLWTIEQGLGSALIDRLILSSDDPLIMEAARLAGCEVSFERPAELASDSATTMNVLRHAMEEIGSGYDYVVLLQPTSPCRQSVDIDGCISRCLETRAPACVSVAELNKPYQWIYRLDRQGRMAPLVPNAPQTSRRQEARPGYYLNGAVYVAQWGWLLETGSFMSPDTVAFVMSRQNSVDIDDLLDLHVAEYILRSRES